MSYAFLAVCLFSALCCIGFRVIDKNFWGMVAKYVASLSFLVVAVLSYTETQNNLTYFVFLFMGLLFCHAGDIFLGAKEIAPSYRKKLIPLGIISFLAGQIFFIITFALTAGFSPIPVIIAACFSLLALIMIFVLKMHLPVYLIILLMAYSFVLAYMTSASIYMYVTLRTAGAMLAMFGGLLFLVSDSILGIAYFKTTNKGHALVISETATYFAAQAFISLSVMFI